MKTIAVINQKGGVDKTTISTGLAKSMAEKHYKVLCIDTDAQGNMSRNFGQKHIAINHCLIVLMQSCPNK